MTMKESSPLESSVGGKITIESKYSVSKETLPLVYTPGVAEVCKAIAEDTKQAKRYTISGNTVAVISDGSAVLGLGNIGPEAALPVMEGKALLFKELGGVNAFPLVLGTQDTEEIITTIRNLTPGLAGINLEDISAPRCFEIERRLKEELDIPVFHDDQHGTAIVILAGLINALKVVEKKKEDISVVIAGAGSAGTATAELLHGYGVVNIILTDSKGIISKDRDDLSGYKMKFIEYTNTKNVSGTLSDALKDADVFIGVSAPSIVNEEDVVAMAEDPIIFAMSNPIPEIMPEIAKAAGAAVVATGRSDFANQVNNALVFPGLFKGLLASGTKDIHPDHMHNVAEALASLIQEPHANEIIPTLFDERVVEAVAKVFE